MASKLTKEDVSAIKRALLDYPKAKLKSIAYHYGVSYDTIWDIKAGRYWKNVEPATEISCPHCGRMIETIKAYCRITDNYYIDEETLEVIGSGGGEDPDTYEYWCGYCGNDLTNYIDKEHKFNIKGGETK